MSLFADWLNATAEARNINRKLDEIMADLSSLKAAASQIQTDVQEAIAALDELAGKVAAGDPIAQADVDAITEQLKSAGQSLDDAVAADNPPADDGTPGDGGAPVEPPADGDTPAQG